MELSIIYIKEICEHALLMLKTSSTTHVKMSSTLLVYRVVGFAQIHNLSF